MQSRVGNVRFHSDNVASFFVQLHNHLPLFGYISYFIRLSRRTAYVEAVV